MSFQHKLIQEYLAAIYIAENVRMGETSIFLDQAFPTWEKVEIHKEVVNFACGILAETDACPVTNHIATILAQIIHNELDSGKQPSIYGHYNPNHPIPLLESFKGEGNVSTVINPHLCEYPACGHPLAEVLANSELVFINGIDENDTLQPSHCPSQLLVCLESVVRKKYDSLWKPLHHIHGNIIALDLYEIISPNVTRLSHFTQLKYLSINKCFEASGEDLADSIEAWGDRPQLIYCKLERMPIPRSVMKGLCKCTQLIYLELPYSDLHDKLDVFMAHAPPGLRKLTLADCSLHGSDVDHITQAVNEGRLTQLQELDIKRNPVGKVALDHLLEAIISTRPHTQLTLQLGRTGVDEASDEDEKQCTELSKQFVSDWQARLVDTNIKVIKMK